MPSTCSPLRYPGGKSRFYKYIKNILNRNNLMGKTYIEPFAGGSGLALKLLMNNDVERVVINDFDQAIYSFWLSVLRHSDQLCEKLRLADVSVNEWEKQHNIFVKGDTTDPVQLGFATFFLNRTNVSGVLDGGIIGGKGQMGQYKIDARFNKEKLLQQIRDISQYKDRIELTNKDAKELFRNNALEIYGDAFVNLDPPYVNKGAQLYKNSFTKDDHKELFLGVSNSKLKWVVTYDICPLVQELYYSYRKSYLEVSYSAGTSKKAKEMIFFSNNLSLPDNIILL